MQARILPNLTADSRPLTAAILSKVRILRRSAVGDLRSGWLEVKFQGQIPIEFEGYMLVRDLEN
jgi:hypothetical protein